MQSTVILLVAALGFAALAIIAGVMGTTVAYIGYMIISSIFCLGVLSGGGIPSKP